MPLIVFFRWLATMFFISSFFHRQIFKFYLNIVNFCIWILSWKCRKHIWFICFENCFWKTVFENNNTWKEQSMPHVWAWVSSLFSLFIHISPSIPLMFHSNLRLSIVMSIWLLTTVSTIETTRICYYVVTETVCFEFIYICSLFMSCVGLWLLQWYISRWYILIISINRLSIY